MITKIIIILIMEKKAALSCRYKFTFTQRANIQRGGGGPKRIALML